MTTKSIAISKDKEKQTRTPKRGELWVSTVTGAIYLMDDKQSGTVVAPNAEMLLGEFTVFHSTITLKPFEGTTTITQEL